MMFNVINRKSGKVSDENSTDPIIITTITSRAKGIFRKIFNIWDRASNKVIDFVGDNCCSCCC